MKSKVLASSTFKNQVENNKWNWTVSFWNKITWSFRRFYQRLKRLIQFTPIIWGGYDWDYRYATDLFKYQLNRMADHLESDRANIVDAKQTASRIRTATRLMDKVFDDEYSTEYFDILDAKYGKMQFKFVPEDDTVPETDQTLYKMEVFYGEEGRYSEEELKQIAEEHSRLFDLSQKKQEKAERILWKYINHNLRSWWD